VVKQKQRKVLDDVAQRLRNVWEELERVINPQPKRVRVPVPIPVRPDPRRRPYSPYR
jgi:hypothetical protein